MSGLLRVAPLLLLLVVVGLLYVALPGGDSPAANALGTPLAGQPVPAFLLPGLGEGERGEAGWTVANADLPERPYLLNVWASWCYACIAEHSVLGRSAAAAGVPLVGLNYRDAPAGALAWLEKYGNIYALILSDQQGELAVGLGVTGVPETFVVDGQGRIRGRRVGAVDESIWREQLLPLIEQLLPTQQQRGLSR